MSEQRKEIRPLSKATILMIEGVSGSGKKNACFTDDGHALPLRDWDTSGSTQGTIVVAVGRQLSHVFEPQGQAHVFRAKRDIKAGEAILGLCPILGTSDRFLEGVLLGLAPYGEMSPQQRAEYDAKKALEAAHALIAKAAESAKGAGIAPDAFAAMMVAASKAQGE